MSVRRRQNWLGQQRVDVPHIKSVESAVSNDFDELLSGLVLGENESYVVRGFSLNMAGAIGSSASGLQLIVEDSSILHGKSDQSGTFFTVPIGTPAETISSTTNDKVDGTFTPSTNNYIGIEFSRDVDDDTTDQVAFWNPTTNVEITKTVPLALMMDYKIVVTTSSFPSNVLPIAIVQTDASNNVVSITDRRPLLYRLGTAGNSSPNPFYSFPWTEGRSENFYTSTSSTLDPFKGGDKQLGSLKDLLDALMTEFKLIKGTAFWYADGIGSISRLRQDTANTAFTGRGNITHSSTTPGQINWSNDLFLSFIGGRLRYRISSNASSTDITLSDNQVAYINLVRGVDITPNLVFTNSSAIVTSVGAVAWTADLQAGDFIKDTSRGDEFYYEILSVDSASQVTLTTTFQETSTGVNGIDSQYAFGVYETNPAPSTDRHIQIADRGSVPFNEDIFWLLYRQDDTGSLAKVYVRMLGGKELEEGEQRQVSDNTSDAILAYMGSANESDSDPDYLNAYLAAAAETTTFTMTSGATISSGDYFPLNSACDEKGYYVDYIVDVVDADPNIPGRTRIPVSIASGDSAVAVGALTHAAINALPEFNSVDNLDGTITVTNAEAGVTTDATTGTMGGSFALNIDTQGAGEKNHFVVDGDNLTQSIKTLDSELNKVSKNAPQDNNLKLIKGGTWSWDLPTNTLAWSADGYVQVPGLQDARNTINTSSAVLDADGKVAYVTVNRVLGADATLTVNIADVDTLSLTKEDFIIARRTGDDIIVGTSSFLLKDGEFLELDGALAEINRYFSQIKINNHESDLDKVRLTDSDEDMLDSSVLSQILGTKLVDFEGAIIDFTTGAVFRANGVTLLGDNFTPFAIPVGHYFWYGIALDEDFVTTQNGQTLKGSITPATTSDAVQADAPFADIVGNKPVGLVQVFNNAGNIEVVKIRRLGPGASTGGDIVVTPGTPPAGIVVDDDGNVCIQLKPEFEETFTLLSPDSTKWDVIVIIDPLFPSFRTLKTVSGSTNPVNNYKILRDDSTELAIKIDNSGAIFLDPVIGSETLVDPLRLEESGTGIVWEVKANNSNQIYLSTASSDANIFKLQNDLGETIYAVKEIEKDLNFGAVVHKYTFNSTTLPDATDVDTISNLTGEAYYDDGSGIGKPIYHDPVTPAWRFASNNAVIGTTPSNSQTLLNNSSAVVAGIDFGDGSTIFAGDFRFSIYRKTDTNKVVSTGTASAQFDPDTSTWKITSETDHEFVGVEFTINASGIVSYVSNDLTGPNYVGELRVKEGVTFDT